MFALAHQSFPDVYHCNYDVWELNFKSEKHPHTLVHIGLVKVAAATMRRTLTTVYIT